MQTPHSTRDIRCFAMVFLSCQFGTGAVLAQTLPVSKGVYRLPYADGTAVTILNDHLTHSSTVNRLDMTGAGAPTTVVAAGAGWIRVIVENRDTFCPNACGANNDCNGDGGTTTAAENNAAQMAACGGYTGPSSFCCERHFEANAGPGTCPCPPGNPGCGATCNNPNNLVWIEHPNGEWSKHTHMQRGSIGTGLDNNGNAGAGRVLDEFVGAGTPLGIEGDVGIATTVHQHFEVAVLKYVEGGTINDWFSAGRWLLCDECNCAGGCGGATCGCAQTNVNRQNRIPVFCQVGFANAGDTVTAGPCDDLCNAPLPDLSGTTITAGTVFYNQVPDTVDNPRGDFVVEANSGAAVRAGERVTLSPGFHAELNSYFSASIGACDTPGGSGE